MALWIVTITKSIYLGGVQIERGMSVEVTSRMFDRRNRMIINRNMDINDAFKRKYGIDLERAGLLSPLYLEATLVGEGNESNDVLGKKGSLLAMMFDMFS